jgi:hypothetical protein
MEGARVFCATPIRRREIELIREVVGGYPSLSRSTSTFSAFFFSAAAVKLKLPVSTPLSPVFARMFPKEQPSPPRPADL